jgi:hypothetical protein
MMLLREVERFDYTSQSRIIAGIWFSPDFAVMREITDVAKITPVPVVRTQIRVLDFRPMKHERFLEKWVKA